MKLFEHFETQDFADKLKSTIDYGALELDPKFHELVAWLKTKDNAEELVAHIKAKAAVYSHNMDAAYAAYLYALLLAESELMSLALINVNNCVHHRDIHLARTVGTMIKDHLKKNGVDRWGLYCYLMAVNHDTVEFTKVGVIVFDLDGMVHSCHQEGYHRAYLRGDCTEEGPERDKYLKSYVEGFKDIWQVKRAQESMGNAMSSTQVGDLLPMNIGFYEKKHENIAEMLYKERCTGYKKPVEGE